MLTSELAEWIPVIVAGAVGYAAGTIIEWRRTRLLGREIPVPQVTRSSRNFTIVVMTLSLLTAGTVIQSNLEQAAQNTCNNEFKRVIATNAAAGAEANESQDALWRDLQQFLEQNPENTVGQIVMSIDRYLDARDSAKTVRQQNQYPDPQCF